MLLQNRLKANAISRSNAGIMSYENGAYEESAYVQHGQNHKILFIFFHWKLTLSVGDLRKLTYI